MLLAGILGGSKPIRRYFFIFLELRKKSKKKFPVKIGFFQKKLEFYREKSVFIGKISDFSSIFFLLIFPPENLFQHHRKPIFRRKIGRKKNDFFVHDCNSLCRDKLSRSQQTSKKMARELCRNNIFYVATQDLKIGR